MLRTQRGGALWLPFTQMQEFDPSERSFVRGDGNYLIDSRGRRVFDAVSSIWTTIHGHCHPAIAEAIAAQAARLDHATLLGASNDRAEELAEQLAAMTGLARVFFASDGASAVEAALKMSVHYWQQAGQPARTRFVHLTNSYHGDTAGAMSVSDIPLFKSRYGAVTFETIPYDAFDPQRCGDVAAVIVEPIVQAAAGMRIVPIETYERMRSIEPLLIVDEIATGFGRTGTMFAMQQLGITPDIVCVGKGLSGGTLPLSATIAGERIFEAFDGAHGEMKHFFHGHSFAGNPIACAAALANIELFERERTLDRVALLCDAIVGRLRALGAHPRVRDVRWAGLMIGIEVEADGRETSRALYDAGYFTRPIGNVIQLVPPLSSTAAELHAFLDALTGVLDRHP